MSTNRYSRLNQLEFAKLKVKFRASIKNFKTWEKDLDEFLKEDALINQSFLISRTYLIFDKKDYEINRNNPEKLKILGYITITNDSISLNGKLKEEFKSKGFNYKALPALKIGRICVDERYERKGLGKMMLAFAILRACGLNQDSACRFITVDAKRNKEKNKDSLHFYTKMGFNILEHKDKTKQDMVKQTSGTIPMFFDIYHISKYIQQKFK